MLPLMFQVLTWVFAPTQALQPPTPRTQLSSRAENNTCDQYIVSGPVTVPFLNYGFWDFRSLGQYANGEPPSITGDEQEGDENITSDFFAQAQFSDVWEIRRGIRNPESEVPMVYSAQNVYIATDPESVSNSTYMTLRTTRLQDFQSVVQLVAPPDKALYASMRTRMKLLPDGRDGENVASGAVFGFFTYASDTQESDIEILTKESTDLVEFTNQPASPTTPGAKARVEIPGNKTWTDWVDYRLDWFEGRSLWYLDDQLIYQSSDSVPTEPSNLMFNLWSNGQTFSGRMRVGREVFVAVQWIEVAYNLSDSLNRTVGQNLCNVDSVEVKGIPEAAPQSSTASVVAASTALSVFTTVGLTLALQLSV